MYGSAGELLSQCDYPAGGSCATASRHTDSAYDALGRATEETAWNGSGTSGPLYERWTRSYGSDSSLGSVNLTRTYGYRGV